MTMTQAQQYMALKKLWAERRAAGRCVWCGSENDHPVWEPCPIFNAEVNDELLLARKFDSVAANE